MATKYAYWKKKSQAEIREVIFNALGENVNYHDQSILGIPASYLDGQVFNKDASFVQDAPYISTLLQNPNHIGCHTLGSSESFFAGTQKIEQELIELCAVDILQAPMQSTDGYVASGGTEANMQAVWIYRNYFIKTKQAKAKEIVILCSEDSHYSADKSSNVFSIDLVKIPVDLETRELSLQGTQQKIKECKAAGKKYFIVLSNMMTTMFGSVDPIETLTEALENEAVDYKLHVDGAYGGFYYPFISKNEALTFKNAKISSFTLDAHKMAQAPYGTGIFLIRKGFMQYANTREAKYVAGEDFTLIGSRSGANAVAVWMILMKNGPFGWHEKIFILQKRTDWLSQQLEEKNIEFYRHPSANILTIKSEYVPDLVAKKYGLVPDNHKEPQWYKIVLMEHVTIDKLQNLLEDMDALTFKNGCVCMDCSNNCKKEKSIKDISIESVKG
jgi:glutamate/tyrosine decarboxylase-like PLP-dependent enzyme